MVIHQYLTQLWARCFEKRNQRATRYRQSARQPVHLARPAEFLEDRTLLSVTSLFDEASGALNIASDAADDVVVTNEAGFVKVNGDDPTHGPLVIEIVSQINVSATGDFANVIDLSGVTTVTFPGLFGAPGTNDPAAVSIESGGGDDLIVVPGLHSVIDGGGGTNTVNVDLLNSSGTVMLTGLGAGELSGTASTGAVSFIGIREFSTENAAGLQVTVSPETDIGPVTVAASGPQTVIMNDEAIVVGTFTTAIVDSFFYVGNDAFNDHVTFDLQEGMVIPAGGATVSGGAGGNDSVAIIGNGTSDVVEYTPDEFTTGNGMVAVNGTRQILFDGLEPVDIEGMVEARLTLRGADDVLTIGDGATRKNEAGLKVSGTSGGVAIEHAVFRNNGAVVIDTTQHSADGDDSVTINATNIVHQNQSLSLRTGAGGDTVAANGDLRLPAGLNIQSGAVIIGTGRLTANELSLDSVSGIGTVAQDLQIDANLFAAATRSVGDVLIDAASHLVIGTVNGISGVTAPGNISLSATDLTVDQNITASAGRIVLGTQSGSVGLGGAAGTFQLDDAELLRISSNDRVSLVAMSANVVNVDPVDLSSWSADLEIRTSVVVVSGLDLGTNDAGFFVTDAIRDRSDLQTDITARHVMLQGDSNASLGALNDAILLKASTFSIDFSVSTADHYVAIDGVSEIVNSIDRNTGNPVANTGVVVQSGGLTVEQGTVKLGSSDVIGIDSRMIVGPTAVLDAAGFSDRFARLDVSPGGTVRGSGALQASSGVDVVGVLDPDGTLNTESVSLRLGGILDIEINGTAAGQHDKLAVKLAGTVLLDGTSDVRLSGTASGIPVGTEIVIVENDGTDPINGMFRSQTVMLNGDAWHINYTAGTNSNDISLIRIPDRVISISGTAMDDRLIVRASGRASGTLQLIQDYKSAAPTVGPVTAFAGIHQLSFNGFGGDDELLIHHPANAVFDPTDNMAPNDPGVIFSGGIGLDSLRQVGGATASVDYFGTNLSTGDIALNGTTSIRYEAELISDGVASNNRSFRAVPGASPAILTLHDGTPGDGNSVVADANTTVSFPNPSTLTLDTTLSQGALNDRISVRSTDSGLMSTRLMLHGGSADTVLLSNSVNPASSLGAQEFRVTGGTFIVQSPVLADTQILSSIENDIHVSAGLETNVAHGRLDLTSASGSVFISDGTLIDVGSSGVTIDAGGGDVQLTGVISTGPVSIRAAGSINDGGNANLDVQSQILQLTASGNVGTITAPLAVDSDYLIGHSGREFVLRDSDEIDVNRYRGMEGITAGGAIQLTAEESIAVNADVTSTLIGSSNGVQLHVEDRVTAGQRISIDAAVTAARSAVVIGAGDQITLMPGSRVEGRDIALELGVGTDALDAGLIEVLGTVTTTGPSPAAVRISGAGGPDEIVIDPLGSGNTVGQFMADAELDGGGGDDAYELVDSNRINGVITIRDANGTDTVEFRTGAGQDTVLIRETNPAGQRMTEVTSSGSGTRMIVDSAVNVLDVFLDGAHDVADVQPLSSTKLNLDGGSPSPIFTGHPSSGDNLRVSGPDLTLSGRATITSLGKADIEYRDFESLAITDTSQFIVPAIFEQSSIEFSLLPGGGATTRISGTTNGERQSMTPITVGPGVNLNFVGGDDGETTLRLLGTDDIDHTTLTMDALTFGEYSMALSDIGFVELVPGDGDSIAIDTAGGLFPVPVNIDGREARADSVRIVGPQNADSFFERIANSEAVRLRHVGGDEEQALWLTAVDTVLDLLPGRLTVTTGDHDEIVSLSGGEHSNSPETGDAETGQFEVEGRRMEFGNKTTASFNTGGGKDEINLLSSVAGLSGDLTINAGDDDDTLIVNFDGGRLGTVVHYHGQGQLSESGDVLELAGGGLFESVVYSYINAHDGAVDVDGQVINYTGLEPISSTVTARNVDLKYGTLGDRISVDRANATQMRVDSNNAEKTDFIPPTDTLKIDAGGGDDDIQINYLPKGLGADLTILGAAGSDTIAFGNTTFEVNGSVTAIADLVVVNGTIDTSQSSTPQTVSLQARRTDLGGAIRIGPGEVRVTGDIRVVGGALIHAQLPTSRVRPGRVVLDSSAEIFADQAGRTLRVVAIEAGSGPPQPGSIGYVKLAKIGSGNGTPLETLNVDANTIDVSQDIRVTSRVTLQGHVVLNRNVTIAVSTVNGVGGRIDLTRTEIHPGSAGRRLRLDASSNAPSSSVVAGGTISLGRFRRGTNNVAVGLDVDISGGPASGVNGIHAVNFNQDAELSAMTAALGDSAAVIIMAAVTVDGTIQVNNGQIVVRAGAELDTSLLLAKSTEIRGNGTIRGKVVQQGGSGSQLSPGLVRTGVLTVDGDVTFPGTGEFLADLQGLRLNGGSSDALLVGGANRVVALGNATLTTRLTTLPRPQVNELIPIIVNQHSGSRVTGTFRGLPEGTIVRNEAFRARITYRGGADNNDVVLRVLREAVRVRPSVLPDQTIRWQLPFLTSEKRTTISLDPTGDDIIVTIGDDDGVFIEPIDIPGAVARAANSVSVPLAAASRLVFDGSGTNDQLTIDNSSGLIPIPIEFHSEDASSRLIVNGTAIVDSFFREIQEGRTRLQHILGDTTQTVFVNGPATMLDLTPGSAVLDTSDRPEQIHVTRGLFVSDPDGSPDTADDLLAPSMGAVSADGRSLFGFAGKSVVTINTGGGSDEIRLHSDMAGVTEELIVNGGDGDDRLTVSLDGGPLTPSITFNGQGQVTEEGDTLALSGGGQFETATYTYDNAHDGVVDVDGQVIRYTGLEPIDAPIQTKNLRIQFRGGAETGMLRAVSDDEMEVVSSKGEKTRFRNPSQTLLVDMGTGNDVLHVESVAANLRAEIVLRGGSGSDTIHFDQLSLQNSLDATSEQIIAHDGLVSGGPSAVGGNIRLQASRSELSGTIQTNGFNLDVTGIVTLSGILNVSTGSAAGSGDVKLGSVIRSGVQSWHLYVSTVGHGNSQPGSITLGQVVENNGVRVYQVSARTRGALILPATIKAEERIELDGDAVLNRSVNLDVSARAGQGDSAGQIDVSGVRFTPARAGLSIVANASFDALNTGHPGYGGSITIGPVLAAAGGARLSLRASTHTTAVVGSSGTIRFADDAAFQQIDVLASSDATLLGNTLVNKSLDVRSSAKIHGGKLLVFGRLKSPFILSVLNSIAGNGSIDGRLVQQSSDGGGFGFQPTFDPLAIHGDISFSAAGIFSARVASNPFTLAIDRLDVNGPNRRVALNNMSLQLHLGTHPLFGTVIPLIVPDHAGTKIIGTFRDLPEGGTLSIGNFNAGVTYKGGPHGNSVLLTVQEYSPFAHGFYNNGVAKFTISENIDSDDPIVVSRDADSGDVILSSRSDTRVYFDASSIPGASSGDNEGTVVIPAAALDKLVFEGEGGDQTLVIDESHGLIPVPIEFRPGSGENRLLFRGSARVDSFFRTTSDGRAVVEHVAGDARQEVRVHGSAEIIDLTPGTTVLSTSDASERIELRQGTSDSDPGSQPGDGSETLPDSDFVPTGILTANGRRLYEFSNKSAVTLNAGGGSDEIYLNSDFTVAGSQLTINGGGGDDRLTVNFDNGPLTSVVNYNGDGQLTDAGDTLALVGGETFETATYNYLNAHDGSVDHDGSLVNYTGLEPIAASTQAQHVKLFLGNGNDLATLRRHGGSQLILASNNAETTVFEEPLQTLLLNTGEGDDQIFLPDLPDMPVGEFTADGDKGTDVILVGDRVNPGQRTVRSRADIILKALEIGIHSTIDTSYAGIADGDVRLLGQNVNLFAGVTTYGREIEVTGTVSVSGHQTLQTLVDRGTVPRSSGGDVKFSGVSTKIGPWPGGGSLTIDTQGNQAGSGGSVFLSDADGLAEFRVLAIGGTTKLPSRIRTKDGIRLTGQVAVTQDTLLDVSSATTDAGTIDLSHAIVLPEAAGLTLTLDAGFDGSQSGQSGDGGHINASGFSDSNGNRLNVEADVHTNTTGAPGRMFLGSPSASPQVGTELLSLQVQTGINGTTGGSLTLQNALVDVTRETHVLGGTLELRDAVLESGDLILSSANVIGTGMIQSDLDPLSLTRTVVSPRGTFGSLIVDGDVKLTPQVVFETAVVPGIVTSAERLIVRGQNRSIDLNNASLAAIGTAVPAGTTLTLIENLDSASSVSGTFQNLPEGAIVSSGATHFRISYAGGVDNNDVTLTALSPMVVGSAQTQGGIVTISPPIRFSGEALRIGLNAEQDRVIVSADEAVFDLSQAPELSGHLTGTIAIPLAELISLNVAGASGDLNLIVDAANGLLPVPVRVFGGDAVDEISVLNLPDGILHNLQEFSDPTGSGQRLNLTNVAGDPLMHLDGVNTESLLLNGQPVIVHPHRPFTNALPELRWSPVHGVQRWEVEITNLSFGEEHDVVFTVDSFFRPAIPLPLGHYSFRVRGEYSDGELTEWSEAAPFSIRPKTDITLEPYDRSGTPRIEWTPVEGGVRYEVRIDSRTTGEEKVAYDDAVLNTHYQPADALPIGWYTVWVRPIGKNDFTGSWCGQTIRIATPPSVIGPTGSNSGVRPVFAWNGVAGAVTYDLWVRRLTPEFEDQIVRAENTAGTSFESPIDLAEGTYRFWVRAFNGEGQAGAWSMPSTFSIAQGSAPDTPERGATQMDPMLTQLLELRRGDEFEQPPSKRRFTPTVPPPSQRGIRQNPVDDRHVPNGGEIELPDPDSVNRAVQHNSGSNELSCLPDDATASIFADWDAVCAHLV